MVDGSQRARSGPDNDDGDASTSSFRDSPRFMETVEEVRPAGSTAAAQLPGGADGGARARSTGAPW